MRTEWLRRVMRRVAGTGPDPSTARGTDPLGMTFRVGYAADRSSALRTGGTPVLRLGWLGFFVGMACAGAFGQQQSVVDSVHNLSAGGPGRIRSTGEQQVCIFCHTP